MATNRSIGRVVKIDRATTSPSVVELSHGGSNVEVETTDEWLLSVLGIALARGHEVAITYDQGPPHVLLSATLAA